MATMNEMVADFLAQERIAVTGFSRENSSVAGSIYYKLKENGLTVFAVHPHMDTFEDDPCYPNLQSIPEGVGAVMIATSPAVTEEIVKDAAEAGVKWVWMHGSFIPGSSVSEKAVAFCEENGMHAIAGGCPMMFVEADFAHVCIKWLGQRTGSIPK